MSAKVTPNDSAVNSTANITTAGAAAAATIASTTTTSTTNGQTPARRLRTRTSTSSGGVGSGGDSAKKNSNNNNNNNINSTNDNNILTTTQTNNNNNNNNNNGNGGGHKNSTNNNTAASSINNDMSDKPMASRKYHNSCPQLTNSVRKVQAHTQPHSSSSFNMNKNEEFHFDTPTECPVFRPTPEEFKNPLAYINKIRPIAEKCGIAKILPPELWSPPFAVDVDKLKFTPRVQRLNELEAKTRVKLNFLDQIAKFWELQGASLKIPMVERKALDLYTLHRIVQQEGGMEQTTKERKWAKVANRMSYPSSKSVGATLKSHYERILHPFEVYTSGKVLGPSQAALSAAAAAANASTDVKMEDGTDYKAHEIPTRQQITPPNENNARRSKRFANSSANCGLGTVARGGGGSIKTETKEDFKRDLINCFNAASVTDGSGVGSATGNTTQKNAGDSQLIDPLMKYICHICNRGDVEESMLLCDGCDDSYHTFCLLPPLSSIPKGEWLCPRCVVEEVSKPTEAFGFEQAEREYTLQQFGQMADQFKTDYFRKPVHLVETELVEREFWRIVSSIDEDVTVEYGADLHTMDHGSGFPTKSSLYLLPGDQEYAESSWNLNNLPLLEDSILGHINADISGMNAPWMYVGMCFAAFCWHNEDHWSYSINYLHWGEPKTWYGVPGSCAEQFEETMKQAAPELFASQPDLLHQLVTIMNPNILMNNGVPVYRTDQNAGEFVITFPRAYHAGFNQGYNFAEAVNFAPADWLKMGRECVNHYSMLRRFCVFSHDELVCKMALEPAKLTFGIATACYIDMAEMVDSEKKLRKSLLEWGVTKAERKAFELVPDDERHCHECNTTCFLSAVSCECTKSIVCLRHYTVLCTCPAEKHTLLYRYTLDEMPLMLQKLKAKAQSFERWLSRCRDIVDANTPTSVSLLELQELCKEAEIKKFPSSLLIDRLNGAVVEAEKCVTVIQQLGINKVRTRSDNNMEAAQYKLTMEELELFVQEIDNLCCIIEEGASVRELLVLGKQFVERANQMLKRTLDKMEEQEMDALINEGGSLRIELTQMSELQIRYKQCRWYKRAYGMRNSTSKLTYNDINTLLTSATEISPSDALIVKEIRKLQEIGAAIEAWEKQAIHYFQNNIQQHELNDIEELLKTSTEIDGQVPSYPLLKDALRKAKEWLRSVEKLEANTPPSSHILEEIVQRGRNIPIKLEELYRMQSHLNSARLWKENSSQAFLKKKTRYTLLEVLMPRSESVNIDCDLKTPYNDEFVKDMTQKQIVDSFKTAEEKELRDMRELRRQNMSKNPLRDDYCLCKNTFNGNMFNCQLCRDWFHEDCVPPPPAMHTIVNGIFSKPRWLCPSCVRSKRPRLDVILPLLVQLQRLPIRLPEDEALRCLAERAMNWQDRARKALDSPDVTEAIEAISKHHRQKKDGGGSTIPTTISSAAATTTPRKSLTTTTTTTQNGNRKDENNTNDDNVDTDDDDVGRLHIVEDAFSNDEDEQNDKNHTTPTTTTGINNDTTALCADAASTNIANVNELPKLLSDSETENLNELMMEGDLMEVTLDESQDLWRVLYAIQPIITSEAAVLVEQHKKRLKKTTTISNTNSDAGDSNDSLLVQSSPNNNNNNVSVGGGSGGSGGGSGRPSLTGSGKKRRTIDPTTGCPVPRKKQHKSVGGSGGGSGGGGGGGGGGNVGNSAKKQRKSDTRQQQQQQQQNQHHQQQDENVENVGTTNNANTINSTPQKQHANGATTNAPTGGHKKRKRTAGGNANGNGGNGNQATAGRKHTARAQTEQQDDDEEECRAESCHKPTGREVDWVQCDGGCNEWFHMYCVGLVRDDIKADDDYICLRCSRNVDESAAHLAEIRVNINRTNDRKSNSPMTPSTGAATPVSMQTTTTAASAAAQATTAAVATAATAPVESSLMNTNLVSSSSITPPILKGRGAQMTR